MSPESASSLWRNGPELLRGIVDCGIVDFKNPGPVHVVKLKGRYFRKVDDSKGGVNHPYLVELDPAHQTEMRKIASQRR